ncbi:MAG: SDR family NAD(P)-dependent oxidoreductase [Leptonema sp. (in: Bacteria)]|nr:SDR family NAD(P)-dependent oxidoreductase [Leptonema sp. (in: bacteria)]
MHTQLNQIWITGSSRGLGKALSDQYIANHTQVVGLSRTNSILSNYFHHIAADFSQPQQIEHTIKRYIASPINIELLILNAAILGPFADLHQTKLNDIETTMAINVWSNKVLIDSLLSLEANRKIQGPKRILAISSGASQSGNRGWNSYSLSKSTLNMLIQLYSKEQPSKGWISLAPGIIHTDMQDQLAKFDSGQFPSLKRLHQALATKVMPKPEAVASQIIRSLDSIFSQPNGSYVDIRNLI